MDTENSTEHRSSTDRRQNVVDRRLGLDRRRGPGRRLSDERKSAEEGQMSDEQFEFLMAVDEYKRKNQRPFPTWTEVLEVIKALGYRKVAEPGPLEPDSNGFPSGFAAEADAESRQVTKDDEEPPASWQDDKVPLGTWQD